MFNVWSVLHVQFVCCIRTLPLVGMYWVVHIPDNDERMCIVLNMFTVYLKNPDLRNLSYEDEG